MNQLNISWCKDLKNCVPFYVKVNGNDIGIIKRGERIQCNLDTSNFELFLVPKAPKLFGWKAVRICAKCQNADTSLIELSVLYNGEALMNSQLHINRTMNVTIVSEELCKKY